MTDDELMERSEWIKLLILCGCFLAIYLLPIGSPSVESALGEGVRLTQWYAREHVILCLLPAFVIAGAIAAFVDKAAVLAYLGPTASRPMAYGVGAISGGLLAVCSCTVLPLFAGIHRMGAGLGPAMTFLYAGPAINVLAVILTARVLGLELGIARAIGAVVFSVLIGLVMVAIFERRPAGGAESRPTPIAPDAAPSRPLGQLGAFFATSIAVLVFANWSAAPDAVGTWAAVHAAKWWLAGASAVLFAIVLWRWFGVPSLGLLAAGTIVTLLAIAFPSEPNVSFAAGVLALCFLMTRSGALGRTWWRETWGYAKLITPLLIGGVFVAGFLLGGPGSRGIVPPGWIEELVGGNGLGATLAASVVGAFMYFATLTEIPILAGLLGAGMGKGPALALLLAGPALSLPSILVIRSVIGNTKTIAYLVVVVLGSAACGLIFGTLF